MNASASGGYSTGGRVTSASTGVPVASFSLESGDGVCTVFRGRINLSRLHGHGLLSNGLPLGSVGDAEDGREHGQGSHSYTHPFCGAYNVIHEGCAKHSETGEDAADDCFCVFLGSHWVTYLPVE